MRELLVCCLITACGSNNASHPDAPSAPQGAVSVIQGFDGAENRGQASAAFAMTSSMGPVVGTDGPCTAYGQAPKGSLDAGSISISGTTSAVTLTASGSPLQYSAGGTLPFPLFTSGATITMSAAGGADIPAFNGTTTAPADIAGFSRPTSLSRAGYTATWTAGSSPRFWVLLAAVDATFTNGVDVVCEVPDSGSFAIPATTFALLPTNLTMGGVSVTRINESDITVGDKQIALNAISEDSSTIIPLTP
jgi:hypothetical protein